MTISGGIRHEVSAGGNIGAAVFIQDQTTNSVDLMFHNILASVTLSTKTVVGLSTVEMTSGHGFSSGEGIGFYEGEFFSQFTVLSVATDTLTLDSAMDKVYTTAANVDRQSYNLKVDGSSTPVVFHVGPHSGQKWDITRVILVMESTANAMDYTGFGPLSPISNGCVVRKSDGVINNVFNWKTNGDFVNRSSIHSFESKTGGGGSGFMAMTTFAGQNNRGVTVRLDGNKNDEIQTLVQDDLVTGATALTKFQMIAQGHVVQ